MTIVAGNPFIKVTYHLEGNRLIIYMHMKRLEYFLLLFPLNIIQISVAVAGKLSSNPVCVQQLIDYAKACVQPAHRYFNEKFRDDLQYSEVSK